MHLSSILALPVSSRVDNLRESINQQVNARVVRPKFQMVRDASHLKMEAFRTDKGNQLSIDLGNGLTHVFDEKSRVTKHLMDTPHAMLEQKLQQSGFFFMELDNKPKLVDFVMGANNRFVHSDDNIRSLIDLLGVSEVPSGRHAHLHGTTQIRSHYLGKAYSTQPISVDTINGDVQGGEFNSLLRFMWSPFSQHINSAFELIRLICANGNVGLANFLNAKVPLINMWQENLDIASQQIQTIVDTKVTKRLENMSRTATNLDVLLNIAKHVEERLKNPEIDDLSKNLLEGVARVVDPVAHLGHIYTDRVFEDRNVAAQLAGHLSKMDAYNICTELSSHSQYNEKSTDNALQKMANALMWTERDFKTSRNIPQPFSSADNAFFGMMA